MSVLQGKVAVVTGASKGIGQALAVGLADHGAKIVVNFKNDGPGAEATVRQILHGGGEAITVQADLGLSSEAKRLIAATVERFGRIDILVNNAARTRFGPASDISDDDWDDVVNTNLRGPFFASVAAFKHMREVGGGAIINISSCAASLLIEWHSLYTMSKTGLEGLTRQLALEYAPFNVRVNAIAPAPTTTERNLKYDPNYNESWVPLIPMKRVGAPEDYVGPLVFLASEQSGFLTGEILHVDGGWTLKGHFPPMESYDLSAERRRG